MHGGDFELHLDGFRSRLYGSANAAALLSSNDHPRSATAAPSSSTNSTTRSPRGRAATSCRSPNTSLSSYAHIRRGTRPRSSAASTAPPSQSSGPSTSSNFCTPSLIILGLPRSSFTPLEFLDLPSLCRLLFEHTLVLHLRYVLAGALPRGVEY